MRRILLISVTIVLLGTLTGALRAFTLPESIMEQYVALRYEQKGQFDYIACMKAAYLFDDFSLETISEEGGNPGGNKATVEKPVVQAAPKFPVDIIERLDITFEYAFISEQAISGDVKETVEVKAVFDNPGRAREELVLVPSENYTGSFVISCSVNGSDLAADSTTITAFVYTTAKDDNGMPVFESFTQNLVIRSNGPLIEFDKNLISSQQASYGNIVYEQTGKFDYGVILKEDSYFGAITLKPPEIPVNPTNSHALTPPVPLSSKTLGPGDTIYFKLFDSVNLTFYYGFEADKPLGQVEEEVEVNAILESPGNWVKTINLVPAARVKGPFSVVFSLGQEEFDQFIEVYRTIEREIGVLVPKTLTILAEVHSVAQTDFGVIEEDFTQSISTSLENDVLEWNEGLSQSKPDEILRLRAVPNLEKVIGLSIGTARGLFVTLSCIAFLALISMVVLFQRDIWLIPEFIPYRDREAAKARRKHKSVLVDVMELPDAEAGNQVIKMDSINELVKTADNLLKPVLHKSEERKHIYCVIDGSTRYEYISE